MLQDYYNNDEEESYEAAKANLDYLLGRNPLEYCFVTGYGSKSPMNPHHRPSIADGIVAPVPGMLVGGPNKSPSDNCDYLYSVPALSYTDQTCSYSTNEIAINWNAPFAFILGAIEAKNRGISPSYKYFPKGWPMAVEKRILNSGIKLYPNPSSNFVSYELKDDLEIEKIELITFSGEVNEVIASNNRIDVSGFSKGSYILKITTQNGVVTEKLVIQ